MKVILLQNVKKIGSKGEVKEVSSGYATNFLIPQKKAAPATAAILAEKQQSDAQKEKQEAQQEARMIKILDELDGKEITISASANAKGGLYKALDVQDVLSHIKKEYDVVFPEDLFLDFTPLKQVGSHTLQCAFGKKKASITLTIAEK